MSEMIEQRRLVEQWDATSEFSANGLYLFTAALVGATRAALSAYNPNERLREALAIFVRAAVPVATEIDPRGHSWCEAYLDEALTIARSALSPLPQGEDT